MRIDSQKFMLFMSKLVYDTNLSAFYRSWEENVNTTIAEEMTFEQWLEKENLLEDE